MKIAILIHVHKNPRQVKLLLEALQHERIDIYVNVDGKVDAQPFHDQSIGFSNVYFIQNRIPIFWGQFSQTEAIVYSFRQLCNSGIKYQHFMFLSGQCYPIKPISDFINFLDSHPQSIFLENRLIGKGGWESELHRFERLHINFENKFTQKAFNSIAKRLPKRKYPLKLRPYGGSCWFCLTQDVVEYSLKFIAKNKNFFLFHKYALYSDEMLFHSIILNSSFSTDVINESLHFILWENSKSNPIVLTDLNYVDLMSSSKYFARKFQGEPFIIDKICKAISSVK